jgi:methionine synthase I (cobalamin-dependent)
VLICDGAMGTMLHAGRDAGRAAIEMAAELLAEAGRSCRARCWR